jgi:hypothetical protein
MKYAVELLSGAMICVPRFIKTDSDIQKLMGGGGEIHWHTDNRKTPKAYFNFFSKQGQ